MNITIIGAGNSGLSMAAHLSMNGHNVNLWNRSRKTIEKLMETHTIYCDGELEGTARISLVTDDLSQALQAPDVVFVTTPASSHRQLAEQIALNLKKESLIVLCPGRTFGALEFKRIFLNFNTEYKQTIAETQSIIYTCRKTSEDSARILSFKDSVKISAVDESENKDLLERLPVCLREYFEPAQSIIETSIGNVGMVLHCAPLLLNSGWTESAGTEYMYYRDGITPTISALIEKIDQERVEVSRKLGVEVESTKEWLERTYHVTGGNIRECIQNNKAYETIAAPSTLNHRYILEDVPCGLVPLEAVGKSLGLEMQTTSLIINLASQLLNRDFREDGRSLKHLFEQESGYFLNVIRKGRMM